MTTIEILKEHCKFGNHYDCFVLLAVSRKKDIPEITNSQEIVFREVIKYENDIVRKYNKIKSMITNYRDENGTSFPFYLYVSLNRRDSKKATFILISKIMHWIEEETKGIDRSEMFKKIHGHFYSSLMMKESRSQGQKYFMIDYDEKKYIGEFLSKLGMLNISVEMVIETRNGYHIKTKPFNRQLLPSTNIYETKTDANIFLEYVEN